MTARPWRVHARACGESGRARWLPVCGLTTARKFSLDPYGGDVDCHVCLYQMGLYMPLSKLREHQLYQSSIACEREHRIWK